MRGLARKLLHAAVGQLELTAAGISLAIQANANVLLGSIHVCPKLYSGGQSKSTNLLAEE
jgi:hypothetical protein